MIGANLGPLPKPPPKEYQLDRYAAGAVLRQGAAVGHRTLPTDQRDESTVGPPGAERDWETMEEKVGSAVRANEDEDEGGRSAVVAIEPPMVGGRHLHLLLDDS